MGSKSCTLIYTDGEAREVLRAKPTLDRDSALRLAHSLFPSERHTLLPDVDIGTLYPPDDELTVASFKGVSIICAQEFALDRPSQLPVEYLEKAGTQTVYLHAMHSVVDWFAYAVWQNGKLVRSLSLSPDDGILEDIGDKLPFELPYWSGHHPVGDPDEAPEHRYPLPFHPLELAEVALLEFVGYQLEGMVSDWLVDPIEIPALRLKREAKGSDVA